MLRGKYSGKYSLESYAKFGIGILTKRVDKAKALEVSLDNLSISFKITNKTLSPFEKTTIKAYAVNPAKEALEDISVFINSNIGNLDMQTVNIKEITGKSNYKLLDINFTAPNISHQYFISVNASYKTLFGQKLKSQAVEYITVVLPSKVTNQTQKNQTQNISIEPSENITHLETVIQEQSSLEETEKVLEKDVKKFSPLPNLKELTSKLRQNSGKTLFIIIDIIIIILILFLILKIKKEKTKQEKLR
tara:strand:- start:1414 stop:2157 length:744 start_codon:yes stop_codon:yes gene_type:complete